MKNTFSLDNSKAKELLPIRPINGNKSTFGRVLIIAGSIKMVGCCELAVTGAFRCGAGLVTLAFPDDIYVPLASRLTENTFMPLPSENGKLSVECLPYLIKVINEFDVVVFGCGVGKGEAINEILREVILNCEKPLVLDADALNALAENLDILKYSKAKILLTPHPGEMSRLVKENIEFIERHREEVVTDFAKKYNVNVLLKGHNSIICKRDATIICVNKTGNTGLSKGGSGDLLSGMIAGLTPSLNGSLYKSACLAAYIHGLSAELASKEISEFSTLPTDCAKKIGKVIKMITEGE